MVPSDLGFSGSFPLRTRYCRGVPDPKIRIFDVGVLLKGYAVLFVLPCGFWACLKQRKRAELLFHFAWLFEPLSVLCFVVVFFHGLSQLEKQHV